MQKFQQPFGNQRQRLGQQIIPVREVIIEKHRVASADGKHVVGYESLQSGHADERRGSSSGRQQHPSATGSR